MSSKVRWMVLTAALEHFPGAEMSKVVSAANSMLEYVTAPTPTVVRIKVGLIRKQADGTPSTTQPEINMQLHDDEQVTYSLDTQDAKGQSISGEAFTCTSSDETVVTVTQDGDVFTAVAGLPGSATLTFASDNGLSVTEAIDVIAGAAVAITLTPGEVTKQPVA